MTERLILQTIAEPRTISVQLDVTNACNLACTHCYHTHHSNSGALRLEDWLTVIEQVRLFVNKYRLIPVFLFCGGEPLLSPLLKPLVAKVSSIWPSSEIVILTNGTIVRDSVLEWLPQSQTSFQISLDGPDANRHDSVRGIGTFQRSIAGVQKLLDNGYLVSILSILSQRTSPWIREYFELALRTGVHAQNFTRLIAEGHGKQLVEGGVDRPLAGQSLKSALTTILLESYRTGIATNTNQPLYALIDQSYGQSGLFGFDSLIIDYKGNLKVTSRTPVTLGNLMHSDLETLYINNSILQDLRKGKIDVCGKCDLYQACGGDRNAAFAEFGSYTARDPGCWK